MRQLLVILLIVWTITARAAGDSETLRLHFSHLGIEQGLSSGAVADVLQDRNGLIWLATQDGLNRYDGSRVQVFRQRGDDQQTLISNNLRILHEDHHGHIWVGSQDKGLSRFDPISGQALRFGATQGLRNLAVRALVSDQSQLWIATRGGLHRIDFKTLALEAIEIPNVDAINALAIDAAGQIWLGTEGAGVLRRDADGQVHQIVEAERVGGPVTQIHVDGADSDIWIGTEGAGLIRVNLLRQTFTRINTREGLAHDHVSDLLRIDSHLWIGLWGGGLQRLHLASGEIETVSSAPSTPGALNHHTISTLFQDRSGVLWVGTWGRGVNLHHRYGPRFQTYRHGADRPDGLSQSPVNFMLPRGRNELLIGTWGSGLDVMDQRTGKVVHYPPRSDDQTAPHNGRFYSILPIGDDSYWIGTDDGISLLDARSMRFSRLSLPRIEGQDPLAEHRVRALLRDRGGDVWIGTETRGLVRYDPATGKVTRYQNKVYRKDSLSHNRVTSLYEDRRGRLWVGTFGGVNRLESDLRTFTHLRAGKAENGAISSDAVLSFFEDDHQTLWIGTKFGLNGLNLESGEVRHFRTSDGLPNDVIYGILPDEEARLWLSTNRGLARFDPKTGRSVDYHRSDGLQAEEFNAGASYRSENGQIYFGGTEGFTTLKPGLILDNPHSPQVQIVDIRSVNRDAMGKGFEPVSAVANQAAFTLDEIYLSWRDLIVQFHFAALHFADPAGNRLAYRLLGLDDEWIEVSGDLPIATFSNLPAGEYTLEVKAANSDGLWHLEPQRLTVNVAPPPWLSTWAYLGYGCAILLGILMALWYFRRKLEKERAINDQLRLADEQLSEANQSLETEVRERTQALLQANRALEELSLTDALTGVRNRRYFSERVVPELSKLVDGRLAGGKREEDALNVVAFMIDIDKFKRLNDSHGHAVGDDVITEFAILLEEQFRQSDHVIRWGGEEFLGLARLKGNVDPRIVAERLRRAVAAHKFCTDRSTLRLSCSIGFARFPFMPTAPDALSIYETIEIADQCLYRAKETGRNRWCGAYAKPGIDVSALREVLKNTESSALDQPNVGVVMLEHQPKKAEPAKR